MTVLTLKILNKDGKTIWEDSGEEQVSLVHQAEYQEGDHIILETSEKDVHVVWQVDDAMGPALCYITDNVSFSIPFGEKRMNYSPKVFYGDTHYLFARVAREDEIKAYRNLALNVCDQNGAAHCFPHAFDNVGVRKEVVFDPRNAIDGVCENRAHWGWPYQSWGINRRKDAELTVDFGREVEADKVVLYTRSDFPHDSWWTQVTLTFSDGTAIDWKLEKSRQPHVINFERKRTSWIRLGNLIKADDPSPFPALTQIEVYGH